MRNFLTFVAIALVTALTFALVVPPFIDWSGRRDFIANAMSARIGAPVRIGGAVKLRLLPTPYLDAADIVIGPPTKPWLSAPAMHADFSFGALFGARLRLENLAFDRPNLRAPLAPLGDNGLELGRVHLTDAEIQIERDGAPPIVLHDVNFDGSARAAGGPWRGEGDFATGGGRGRFAFATEALSGDALPLKLSIDAGDNRADLDGALTFGPAPTFEGSAALSGKLEAWPWRVSGAAHAKGDEIRLEGANLRLGQDARSLEAQGDLSLRLNALPALDADLKAKTLNFDALLRHDDETSAPPSRFFATLAALTVRPAGLAGVSLRLTSDSAYLGARALAALKLKLVAVSGGDARFQLETGLPGQGRLAFDGTLETGPAPLLRGHGDTKVGAFAPLAAWIAEGDADLAARLQSFAAALPDGDIAAAGDFELSSEGASARELDLSFGATRFTGGAVYTAPAEDRAGRLYLDLDTDALDIAQAPNLEAGLNWLGPNDLDLRLQAGAVKVDRVGLASAHGGALTLRAKKDGPKFSLDKLAIADLGGASFNVEGETSPLGRWLRVTLDAGRLGDLAALVARAAPGAPARWFLAHADDLGPAKATIEARRDGPPLEGPFGLDFLKADGVVSGARFGLKLSRAPAPVNAISTEASLDAPDAGALLRRTGAKFAPGSPGRAELSLSGTGLWESGFDGKARLVLAGSTLTFSGTLRRDGDDAALAGPITFKSADVFPALAALGYGASGLGVQAPVDLTADLAFDPKGTRLSRLAGTAAGARVGGEVFASSAADAASALEGKLDLDRASGGALVALILGKPGPLRPGAAWPDTKFGPSLLTPPSIDLALKIDAFDLGFTVARATTAQLHMERGRIALDNVALTLGAGTAGGRLDLRRDKTVATASGKLDWRDVAVDKPGWRGKLGGALDFAGIGETTAGLIANLTGTGEGKASEAAISRFDPEGFARAYARIEQAAGAPPEPRRLDAQIAAEIDRAPLVAPQAEGGLSLSNGALRFGPFTVPTREGSARVVTTIGLVDLSFAPEATLTDTKVSAFWSGAPPSLTVSGKSGLDALPGARRVDATLFSAGLAAEAVARESERIANFEADIRERAMFNRKLKAARFIARRDAEIAAFLDEQERRRLADEYRRAYDGWPALRGSEP